MLEEIIKNLKSLSCNELREMADQTDLAFNTLYFIRIGRIKDPKLSTALKIQEYFSKY